MTLENLKEGEHEPSSHFTVCQGEGRTSEVVLTQEHAWCGSRNSKEGSYGCSGVIREESHRRRAESKTGRGREEQSHSTTRTWAFTLQYEVLSKC